MGKRKNSDDLYKEIQALKGQMAAEHRASTHTFVAMLQRYTKDIVNEIGAATKKLAKNIADNGAAIRDEGQKVRDHVTAEHKKTRDHVTDEHKKTRDHVSHESDRIMDAIAGSIIPFLIAVIVGLVVFVLYFGAVKKETQAALANPETTKSWYVDDGKTLDHTEYTYSEDGEKVESATPVYTYNATVNNKRYRWWPAIVALLAFSVTLLIATQIASRIRR